MLLLPLVRMVVLCVTNLFALTVLALSAYSLSQIPAVDGFYFIYASFGLATAVLHLCSVIPMIILSRIRDGAYTSRPAFEVGWLSFLCGMWIGTGGDAVPILGTVLYGCVGPLCGAAQAVAAFAFLNSAMLLAYVITLVTFVVKASQAGQNVWSTDVNHVRWVQGRPMVMALNFTGAAYPPGSKPMHVVGIISPGSSIPQCNYTNCNPGPQRGGTYTAQP